MSSFARHENTKVFCKGFLLCFSVCCSWIWRRRKSSSKVWPSIKVTRKEESERNHLTRKIGNERRPFQVLDKGDCLGMSQKATFWPKTSPLSQLSPGFFWNLVHVTMRCTCWGAWCSSLSTVATWWWGSNAAPLTNLKNNQVKATLWLKGSPSRVGAFQQL